MPEISAADRLIVPLDFSSADAAQDMIDQLDDAVRFFKVGMELQYGAGLGIVDRLVTRGKKVFLDVKLLDIDNTVERAVANIAQAGVTVMTVHAYPQTMAAAVRGRGSSDLKLLGVTVLTTMAHSDFSEAGYAGTIEELVLRRASQAAALGMDGVVASPLEARSIRAQSEPEFIVATPGIRPSGTAANDQKRITTPAQALRNGASHLVVGRPITRADNPAAAARAVIEEMKTALPA